MEPNCYFRAAKITQFLRQEKPSPTFQEYQLKLIALCREKYIHKALLLIGEDINGTKTLTYLKADNGVYSTIVTRSTCVCFSSFSSCGTYSIWCILWTSALLRIEWTLYGWTKASIDFQFGNDNLWRKSCDKTDRLFFYLFLTCKINIELN